MEKSVLLFRFCFLNGILAQLKKDHSSLNFVTIQNITKLTEEDVEKLGAFGIFIWGLFQSAFEAYKCLMYSICRQVNTVSPKNVGVFLSLLKEISELFQEYRFSSSLYKTAMHQTVFFMDIHVFNSFLNDYQLCSASSALKLKMQISQIEAGVKQNTVLRSIFNESMIYSRDLVNLLVMDKSMASDPTTAKEVFPNLNVLQMKTVLQQFKPDDVNPDKIDSKIILALENEIKKQKGWHLKISDEIKNIPKIF